MKPTDVRYKKAGLGLVRAGAMLLLFLAGAGIGAIAYRSAVRDSPAVPAVAPVATESMPYLIRDEQGVTIPDGSPLRDKLRVEAVGEKEIKRNLVLPAVVEADPARLVKVLPPLAGRVTQLQVQLGEE